MRLRFLLSVVGVGLAAPIGTFAALHTYAVRPHDTDAAITQFNQPHRIFLDEAAPPHGELLVYLPGTGAGTTDQAEFGRTAAEAGYHVVYLMYPNDTPAAVCQGDEDPATFERFRREVIQGHDRDPRVTVDRANSIENRLVKLLQWLAEHRGGEGWGRYLAAGEILWPKVALAGHSQGGGHAQLMAKDHPVARVVVLGSPKDYNLHHGAPAAWYGGGATPPARLFAFVHRQDTQACSYAQQLENLRASGLTTCADIDTSSAPYGHARILSTNLPGGTVNSALAHLSLVFDFALPRQEGRNPFRPVWRYMLTEPVE